MTLRRAALLLLLSSLLADAEESAIRAVVGSNAKLSCIYPEEKSFDLNKLFVYWQINVNGKPESVTYYLAGNSSVGHGNNQYKDRAQISLDSIKQGDFSLHLYNITPQDERDFHCLVFLSLEKIRHIVVPLQVAANYSMPVVSHSQSDPQDEELTFTCTSRDGYPKPNVYWINKTDNSLLDEALQNSTVTLNLRGLYDVVSVLRIRQTPNMNIGCCIENVLLHQNLTDSSQADSIPGKNDSIRGNPGDTHLENPSDTHSEKTRTLLAVLIVLGLAAMAAVTVAWRCRSRFPHWSYAGARTSRLELGCTEHV